MRVALPLLGLIVFLELNACLAAESTQGASPAAAGPGGGAVPPAAAGGAVLPAAAGGAGAAAPAAAPDMRALLAEYASDSRSVRDFYTVERSATRLQREDALDATWSARLDALDYEALATDGRVDWLLLRNELRHHGQRRDATRRKLEETAPLLPFAGEIAALEEARWRLAPVDPEAVASQLDALAKAIKAVKGRAEKGSKQATRAKAGEEDDEDAKADDENAGAAAEPASEAPSAGSDATPGTDGPPLATTPVIAQRAAGEIDALKRALETWFTHYDQFVPGFSWWTRKPYDAATEALTDYAKLLREDIAGLKGKDDDPLVGDPIGRQALLDDVAAELIDYTPEELLAIGEREFAWCEAQMQLAAADMGLGEDWRAALGAVKADHVPPGEQDALVVAQSKEAIAFLDAHDLVTIPELCRETWRVRMLGADEQRTLPYAAYGGQDMLVAYPTRDMDQETKLMTMRGNNVHFSRIVVPHELIPGHHLQGFVAERSQPHRRTFGTPFLGEGWALYWEMRLWELGWPRGPEDRVGMLFWRMHRAARIIISLKFHLGDMTPQQMIDFLVERVGHEKAGATSEVRRYIGGGYGPLYQCAYMIGGLQLRALHDELVGGAMYGERAFHDAVLAQNSIPVKLIREALLPTEHGGGAPTRSGPPAWRFAGDP